MTKQMMQLIGWGASAWLRDFREGKPLAPGDAMDLACYLYADGRRAFL